ncbi:glycosyltransferase family 4 protein [Flavobacterium sp.]|uniref:glycosyltransferase family 4 protein n=1 Tax=Flavobacterium sp. TaxID=239 RepID=UPI003753A1F6
MKTKLLYITNAIKGAAGLERVLAIKTSYLAEQLNYDVHILVLNHNNASVFYNFSSKISIHDISVTGNSFQYLKKYCKGIQDTISIVKPDVISVCDDGLKAFFLPQIINKKIPIIYERHVSKIIELGLNPSIFKLISSKVKFIAMNYLAKSFDKFVVLTNDNMQEWKLDNLIVISNPLSFYPQESSTLQNKKVIAVGKQGVQKGYDRLLNSWQIVNQKHPSWQLSIYGSFETSGDLVSQVKTLQLQNSVSFYEPVKNIEEKFLESSIFAFSSRFEGFGMVLIEAMACGLPCVSFNCPCGPSEIIKNNEDGFLVENGNTTSFAEKLLFLIENESQRIEMGKTAKQNVKRYLPENIMPQWDNLFKELLQ